MLNSRPHGIEPEYPAEARRITGVVLAGGRATRVGGVDKGLLRLHGTPLVCHALGILRPQTGMVLISANRNIAFYGALGARVVQDSQPEYAGPLAGLEGAMDVSVTDYILSIPCDCPFLPKFLASRLLAVLLEEQVDVSLAHDGTRLQPLVALYRRELRSALTEALSNGQRAALPWIQSQRHAVADFSDTPESFTNINTLSDLARAEGCATSWTNSIALDSRE